MICCDVVAQRCADYYKAGARFAKWRSVVSIPAGPTRTAVTDCAYGLARYAAIAQNAGLVPIVEPEILLDGSHDIDRTLEVAEAVWAETFKYLADNKVVFEGILLKPSMVTPGAEHAKKSSPDEVAAYTLNLLRRRVPPAVPGIMFLSGAWRARSRTHNLCVGRGLARLRVRVAGGTLGAQAACRLLHAPNLARTTSSAARRRPVRAGGDPQPERHEPEPQPLARVVLLRARAPEQRAQDLEGRRGQRAGGPGGAVEARQGQL